MSQPAARLRVVLPMGGSENPYTALLATALEAEGMTVLRCPDYPRVPLWTAWRQYAPVDVYHLQWHHGLVTDRTLHGAVLNTAKTVAQILWLRAHGVRVVWTVHELVNFDQRQPRWARWACRLVGAAVSHLVVHSPAVVAEVAAACGRRPRAITVVPHGHFLDAYPAPPPRALARMRLGIAPEVPLFVFVGSVRAYKGLAPLIAAFREAAPPTARLLIAGRATQPAYAELLQRMAATDPRIQLDFRYLTPVELVNRIAAATVIVLPHSDGLTSGSALLAASMGRVTLCPARGSMQDLPDEIVVRYAADAPGALADAIRRVGAVDTETAEPRARAWATAQSWADVARQLRAVYTDTPLAPPPAPDAPPCA